MPAIDTFDWLKQHVWNQLDEKSRTRLEGLRSYLLNIRNENERRRFVEEVIREVKSSIQGQASPRS